MKLQRLDFDDDEMPSAVTATLTIDEAGYLATIIGRMKGSESANVMRGGSEMNSEIYNCFVGSVFNRYWDDGIDDYMRARK